MSCLAKRLVSHSQPVKKGTNGGVTKAGLLAAVAAGTTVGVTFLVFGLFTVRCASDVALKQLLVIPFSALAGLCGSLIDSVLGATIQFSGFCSVRNKVSFERTHVNICGGSKEESIFVDGMLRAGCRETRADCKEDIRCGHS